MPRFAGHHIPAPRVGLFLVEGAVLVIAARAGWALAPHPAPSVVMPVVCALAIQVAFYLADLYDTAVAADDARARRRLLGALGLIAAAATPLVLAAPPAARTGVPFALATSALGATALRSVGPWRAFRPRVFLAASGAAAAELERELRDGEEELIVGRAAPSAPDLIHRVRASRAEVVVVACDDQRGISPAALLACRTSGIQVLEAVRYLERTRRKVPVPLLRPAALIYDEGFRRSDLGDVVRRGLSLAVALALAIVTLPIALVCAVAIRLDSPGPILYRQARVGRGGRIFTIRKFRTMVAHAEAATGPVWAREQDPRVTRVGAFLRRTRLDELPQLVNVLTGDMDLVGPRPERPEFVEALRHDLPFYELRSLLRPGITGWAQIRYPYGASVDDAREKLGYDLYYVKHASALLDAIVLFHTAKVVLTGKGAR